MGTSVKHCTQQQVTTMGQLERRTYLMITICLQEFNSSVFLTRGDLNGTELYYSLLWFFVYYVHNIT